MGVAYGRPTVDYNPHTLQLAYTGPLVQACAALAARAQADECLCAPAVQEAVGTSLGDPLEPQGGPDMAELVPVGACPADDPRPPQWALVPGPLARRRALTGFARAALLTAAPRSPADWREGAGEAPLTFPLAEAFPIPALRGRRPQAADEVSPSP